MNAYSIKDAEDALSKRQVQRRENRLFDIVYDLTFGELTSWYLDLKSVIDKG